MDKIRKLPLPRSNVSFDGKHKDGLKVISHKWHMGFQESRPLYPDGFEEAERNAPTWFRNDRCQYYVIVVVPEGEIRYYGEGQTFILRGSKVLVIPQGTDYSFKTTANCHYKKISLFLLGVDLNAITSSLGLDRMETITIPDIDYVVSSMRKIDTLLQNNNPESMPVMAGMAFELLNRLSMFKIRTDRKSLLFQMVKSRLSSDFRRAVKVSSLAEEFNISVITLERMFKKELNTTPAKYRISRKISRAQELLEHSNLSTKEIAYELGYCHQFHFSNEFRRVTGTSPDKYRKQNT